VSGGIKKWLMLQMWRIQQVAQILTIALLAVNLTLTVYSYMEWREGTWFGTPYIGGTLILLALAAGIWTFAIIWDIRLKMWREQMTVVAEKNPFAKEKMTPKEITMVHILWLPVLERLGKDDPKVKEYADALRYWARRSMTEDRIAQAEVRKILEYIGGVETDIFEPKAK
jgi:hypothetical protein